LEIIVDLIILAIFAICLGLGFKKGLTGSLLKIISFILALVIAFLLFKPVSNFIVDHTNWDETLEQAIRQTLIEENSQENNQEENIEIQNGEGKEAQIGNEEKVKKQSMSEVMIDYINETIENAGTEAKNTIVDATARNAAVTIINVGVLIVLFVVSRIILVFIKGLTQLITKLPIIKQFDKLGGILYGLLEAFIIIYVILAILSFVSPMISQTGILQAIENSFLGSIMYNNNLLLKLIF
jgi:uncharacterized membrane protein required for colicin V production